MHNDIGYKFYTIRLLIKIYDITEKRKYVEHTTISGQARSTAAAARAWKEGTGGERSGIRNFECFFPPPAVFLAFQSQ